jgi:hypothetical protein
MSVPELRKEVLRQCDVFQAILSFNYQFDENDRRFLTEIRLNAPTAHAKQLRDVRDTLRSNISRASKAFSLKEKPEKFAKWFKESSRNKLGHLQMPKWIIDSEIFGNFGADPVAWRRFPHHAQIGLDFERSFAIGQVEFYLPEAVLYEDMCASFNLALESHRSVEQKPAVKLEIKKHYLFLRMAVLSAYYFVEAYLNGLAFDYWWDNQRKVSTADGDLLTEWDSARGVKRWRNFRTKALQYPKLIVGSGHPLLTETNSASLKTLLTMGKEIRDAIVHQSPRPEGGEISAKMKWLPQLRLNDVAAVVDAAVGFVLELNPRLGNYSIQLDWIYARGTDGLFPKECFQ